MVKRKRGAEVTTTAAYPGSKITTAKVRANSTQNDTNGVKTSQNPSISILDSTASKIPRTDSHTDVKTTSVVIQIITGSYERVLHGITATINSSSKQPSAEFADSFLFNAHASAIRCLALSPMSSEPGQGVYLATGGSDERINVYSLSASPLLESDAKGRKLPAIPTLGSNQISENPGNRELGTLVQHSSNITALHFPTRSKLLAASEDNTISISRTRDLSVVSTVKAPRPKAVGQPSGDTAPVGVTPAGVNDFAVHPSMKLMVSVGKGERCMRLWNLVTGKKAGVLNFDRNFLAVAKESKYSSGEGRRIQWNSLGTEFAVAFERAVVVFGQDSQVKCLALPQPLTKVHQIAYTSLRPDCERLIISTEDGRMIFYNTTQLSSETNSKNDIMLAKAVVQVGGKAAGVPSRIKDFVVLPITEGDRGELYLVAAGSDGIVRIWQILASSLENDRGDSNSSTKLVGTYETGSRITCLGAYIMLPPDDLEGGFSEFEDTSGPEDENETSSNDGE